MGRLDGTVGRVGETTFRVLGAMAAVYHTAEEEVLGLYEQRARIFHEAASDPALHHLCRDGALSEEAIGPDDLPGLLTPTTARISGRAVARLHHDHTPWRPPFDLHYDEQPWIDLDQYLHHQDMDYVLDTMFDLAEGHPVDAADTCLVFSDLYRLSIRDSEQPIANGTLLDFVRALDVIGVETQRVSQ